MQANLKTRFTFLHCITSSTSLEKSPLTSAQQGQCERIRLAEASATSHASSSRNECEAPLNRLNSRNDPEPDPDNGFVWTYQRPEARPVAMVGVCLRSGTFLP